MTDKNTAKMPPDWPDALLLVLLLALVGALIYLYTLFPV